MSGSTTRGGNRYDVINKCVVLTTRAARRGSVLSPDNEAQRLFQENPNCGMSELEIAGLLRKLVGNGHGG